MVQRVLRDALAESLRNREGERINMVLSVCHSTIMPLVKPLGPYTRFQDSPDPFPTMPEGGELRPWILQEVKTWKATLFPKPINSSPTVSWGGLCPPCFPPWLCCQALAALHSILNASQAVGKLLD